MSTSLYIRLQEVIREREAARRRLFETLREAREQRDAFRSEWDMRQSLLDELLRVPKVEPSQVTPIEWPTWSEPNQHRPGPTRKLRSHVHNCPECQTSGPVGFGYMACSDP